MNRTDATIGLEDLLAGGLEVHDEMAVRTAMMRLGEIETNLAHYLDREVVQIAGKLVLAGATPPVCREMTTTILALVITVFFAQRRASNRLWQDAMAGTPLAHLAMLAAPPEPPAEED